MSSRRVNFRESPPAGARYTSDSGVGTQSDQASRASRGIPGSVPAQWNNLEALQEAYRALYAEKDHYRSKAKKMDEELTNAHKNTKEVEAKWRGIVERNEQLEEDKLKLFKDRKALEQRVDELEAENEELRQHLEKHRKRSSQSPPTMRGGNPESKPRRAASKRESRNDAEPSSSKPSKGPSRHPSSEVRSDATSKATKSSRRASYVEPWGHGGESIPTTSAPPLSQQYPTYAKTSMGAPVISPMQAPTYASVPQSFYSEAPLPAVHPTVVYTPQDYYQEPGEYIPHPLPKDPRGHRSSRGG